MSNALDPILAETRRRVAARRAALDAETLAQRARERAEADPPRGFAAALRRPGLSIIAEHKRSSPSAGVIREDLVLEDVVGAYERGGAAALSVLTEEASFGGSLADLGRARAAAQLPILRKDFIVDPYQVIEARAAGAGGVLVILRMLSRDRLGALIEQAGKLGLFVLLEAFDAGDIELMHEIVDRYAGQDVELLGGVNCRDLTTLQIVPRRLDELAHLLPTRVPRVAESGVVSADDARRVAAAGYELALVGSALMQGGDPGALAAAMLHAGRAARTSAG